MSSINGLGNVSQIQPTQSLIGKSAASATPEAKAPLSDRLELSGASQFLQTLKTNGVRADKVADIKAQITNGTYDADGSKLDVATGKLLDELSK